MLRGVWCIAFLVSGCGRIAYDVGADTLQNGLIAWYPLDSVAGGMVGDASGNGHDAACVPDPARCPSVVDGRIDSALEFDEVRHLRVANDGFFETPDGFTIAAWVWLEEVKSSAPLSKMFGTGDGNTWQLEFSGDSRPAFTTANTGGHRIDYAAGPVEPATWVHLAGIWDGEFKRLFVNGIKEYEIRFVVDWDGSDILIGGDENDGVPAYMFGGRVDDVRVYDRALDSEEVATLARAQ